LPGLAAIPIVTTATLAVGMMAQRAIALNKARRDSPWSYVISLRRKLGKDGVIAHVPVRRPDLEAGVSQLAKSGHRWDEKVDPRSRMALSYQ